MRKFMHLINLANSILHAVSVGLSDFQSNYKPMFLEEKKEVEVKQIKKEENGVSISEQQ